MTQRLEQMNASLSANIINSNEKLSQNIHYIDEHMGLSELPQGLQDTARLRLQYPDVSLNDLVEYSGGLGKSGINHRLKKLHVLVLRHR